MLAKRSERLGRPARRPGVTTAVLSLTLLASATLAGATPRLAGATASRPSWTQQGVLTADPVAAGDQFGNVTLSASGTTAIVGAPSRDADGHATAGAVFVFVDNGSGWVQQAELTPSDLAQGDAFGYSVATSKDGSTVVVGAPFKTVAGKNHAGAAYVFTRSGTTWTQQAELTGAPPGPGNFFGNDVAVNGIGATAAVAAPSKNVTHLRHAGAVYVYKRVGKTWSQNGFLTEPEPAANAYFGWAIGAKETQVLVSSPFHANANGSSGVVYGFDDPAGTYVHQTTLTAADGKANDGFGASLDISVATMVVGATGHVGANGTGAAYVFTHNDRTGVWRSRAELTVPDGNAGDDFGETIAISGTNVAVGDTAHDVGPNNSQGAVYVFAGSGSTWSQPAELTASDGGALTSFGQSVAVSATTVMVGEPNHAVDGLNGAGLVDVFRENTGPQI